MASRLPAMTDIPTFPLAGWDIGTGPGCILLRVLYLRDPEDSTPAAGLLHPMTAEQAGELARALWAEAATLKPSEAP